MPSVIHRLNVLPSCALDTLEICLFQLIFLHSDTLSRTHPHPKRGGGHGALKDEVLKSSLTSTWHSASSSTAILPPVQSET